MASDVDSAEAQDDVQVALREERRAVAPVAGIIQRLQHLGVRRHLRELHSARRRARDPLRRVELKPHLAAGAVRCRQQPPRARRRGARLLGIPQHVHVATAGSLPGDHHLDRLRQPKLAPQAFRCRRRRPRPFLEHLLAADQQHHGCSHHGHQLKNPFAYMHRVPPVGPSPLKVPGPSQDPTRKRTVVTSPDVFASGDRELTRSPHGDCYIPPETRHGRPALSLALVGSVPCPPGRVHPSRLDRNTLLLNALRR